MCDAVELLPCANGECAFVAERAIEVSEPKWELAGAVDVDVVWTEPAGVFLERILGRFDFLKVRSLENRLRGHDFDTARLELGDEVIVGCVGDRLHVGFAYIVE